VELAAAVALTFVPLALVMVKVTLAPAAAEVPLSALAVRVTFWPDVKVEPGGVKVAVSVGTATVTTVAFAVADPTNELLAALVALTLTAYVPGKVPVGAVSVIVSELVWPGLSVRDVAEKVVGQPEGWLEVGSKTLEAHPVESLLVTDSV
jgi:hypothetical protein